MAVIYDVNKSIKENGLLKTVLILLLIIGLSMIGGYYIIVNIGNSTQSLQNTANVGLQFTNGTTGQDNDSINKIIDDKKGGCIEGKFEDSLNDWEITQYDKPDEEGFYCPRLRSPFSSPDIWYKKDMPTKFESIEIRYKLRNKNDKDTTPPSFILSVGKELRIFRIYVPEKSPQLIGFENVYMGDGGIDLKRVDPKKLEKGPIRYGPEAEMNIQFTAKESNKVTYTFTLKYFSDTADGPVEEALNYDVNLPDPDLKSKYSIQRLGLGTFKGDCIKPISYKFCY